MAEKKNGTQGAGPATATETAVGPENLVGRLDQHNKGRL
jgi:hypothetical protein